MDGPRQAEQLVEAITAEHGTDRLAALRAAREVADDLALAADAVLGHFVSAARDGGMSWTAIGETLGVSKQAAQQRFAARSAGDRITVGAGLFSRFAPELSEAVVNATFRARAHGAREVTAEDLLVGAVTIRDSRAAAILRLLDPELAATLTASRGRSVGMLRRRGTLPFSMDARAAFGRLESILEEQGLATVGTGHLLLALTALPDLGTRLEAHGVTERRVEEILG